MRGRRKRKAERREREKAGGNKMEGRRVWQFELKVAGGAGRYSRTDGLY